MIVISEQGVRYVNVRGHWVLAVRGEDIPESEYDRMPSWEMYQVLSAFASCGDEPVCVRE